MQISALFILEAINIAIAIVFLFLFLYRLLYLGHFSQTDKYLNYYPKIRILFAILYVSLSLALLIYNIIAKQYQGDPSKYLFAGGGGETINSLVLGLQLIVLRQQLKKQRPYTPTHMVYFFYLVIISIVRFCLTLTSLIQQQENQQIVDLVLATCLMLDSCIQLGYWIAKKQSLPEFQTNHYFSFDQFRRVQSSRQVIFNNRNELSSRMEQKSLEDDFPYIKPTVNVENSRFRVILEVLASNNVLPANFDSTDVEKLFLTPSQIHNKNVSQVLRKSISLRNSMAKSHMKSQRPSFHLQIISERLYNLQQVKQLYIICGRFPVKKEICFQDLALRQIGMSLQQYLDEVFECKSYYQPFLLKFFQLDRQLIKIYQQKTKGAEDIMCSDNIQSIGSSNINFHSHFDKNAIFLSIQIYKQLWIEDHYQFYMKVFVKENQVLSYPMRRFSEFEELDAQLRMLFMQLPHTQSHLLPPLPKKHLFYLDDLKINHRRIQLETYLRKLCNDYTIVEIIPIREVLLKFLNLSTKILHLTPVYEQNFYSQVKVVKGNISKALINNDYVTFYEFRLFRQGIQIRAINKRFSDFVTLNQDISRWMSNIQICYKSIQFPQKHLFKSEPNRHQKLRNYLQSIIAIKQSYQVYPLNVFLNISGNSQLSDDTFYSAISFVKSKGKESSMDWNRGNSSRGVREYELEVELEMEKNPSQFSYSIDGKRMSVLIDQLGRDQDQDRQ